MTRSLHFDFWLQESVEFELLYVVEGVPYLLIWEQRHSSFVFMENHEELFLLISLDDISDDVVCVLNIHSKHLDSFPSVPYWFDSFFVNSFLQVADPEIFSQSSIGNNSRLDKSGGDEEVLVDVVQQVLEVDIYTCFGVNCGLFVGQKVIKLYYSYCHCLVFLCLHHKLTKLNILYQFGEHSGIKVAALREIPPIFASQGCICVIA